MDPKIVDVLDYIDNQVARLQEQIELATERSEENTNVETLAKEMALMAKQNGLLQVKVYILNNHQ